MSRIESVITVPKSIEETFSFLSKSESHLNFIPRMTALNQTSQGDFGQVGTTADGILNYFGIKIPVQYEIIEHESDRRLAMKGNMGPVLFQDGYVLSSFENGTRIKFWLELNLTGWTKIFSPFIALISKIHAWETLRNLKRELEIWHSSSKEELATPSTPTNTMT
jgi:hypothetical protein